MRSPIGPRVARAACAAATALLLIGTVPVQAHSPTIGYSRGSFADVPDQTVPYRFGATYAAWLTGPVRDSLDTKYRSWTNNNSRGPVPAYGSTGRAVVYYSGAAISPCSGTNSQWLQCATGGGTMSFAIYVRDFDRAPYSDWRWYDKAGTCVKPTGVLATGCWYLRRAMIHEAGHAIPTFGHDTQTEADTVMRSVSPQVGAAGGGTSVFQRCDQAALQLLWDVADHTRPYGDCFDHVAGHGVRGLLTSATTNGTSFQTCIGATKLVGGRLAVRIEPLYGRLSNNPLAGRTLWFDRKPHAATTWTLRAESATPTADETGTNWTRTFASPSSTGATYDYRAHFDGGLGLDASNMATFSITWSKPC